MASYNTTKIENWYNDFVRYKNKFNNEYYTDYTSSYIKTNYNDVNSKIRTSLDKNYNKIKDLYKSIDTYWKNLIDDIKNADAVMAGTQKSGSIHSSSVVSALNSLPELEEYEVTLDTRFASASATVGTQKNVQWMEDNLSWERIGATLSTFGVSLLEGVVNITEAAVDLVEITAAAISTLFTGTVDLVNLAAAEITGDESKKTNHTAQLWEDTRAVVSEDISATIFDAFYENTEAGKWMKENCYGFEITRAIGGEVAEVAVVIALSTVTGGSAAVIYGTLKVGEHIEENWQDESKSTAEGLVEGIFEGTADGIFFAVGQKGDQVAKNVVSKIGQEGSKQFFQKSVVLLGKMGYEGITAVAQDGTNMMIDALFMDNTVVDENGNKIVFDNYIDKLTYSYNQAGGKDAFVESLITSVLLSGVSDASDVFGKARNIDVDNAARNASKNADVDTNALRKEYDDLLKKTNEPWFINAKEARDNAYVGNLRDIKDVDDTLNRMTEIEEQLESVLQKTDNQSARVDLEATAELPIIDPETINPETVTRNPIIDLETTAELPIIDPKTVTPMPDLDATNASSNGVNSAYSQNIVAYKQQGISFEKYASQNGIEIKNYSDDLELAVDLGDENWYLVNILKDNKSNMTPDEIAKVDSAINKPRCDLDSSELFNLARPYLDSNNITDLNKIVSNPNMENLTTQQKHTLFQFQRAGGCEINNMLRGKDYSAYGINSYYDIECEMQRPGGAYRKAADENAAHPRIIDKKNTIVEQIDDIIKNNSNTTTIKGVGYYDSAGPNIPTQNVLNLIDATGINSPDTLQALNDLIGLDMTDKAFNSRTIPADKLTAYSNDYEIGVKRIKIESYISPGCGAYIDTYGSFPDGLGEMLIKRNCKQTIVDAYVDPNTNNLVLVTLYS